MIGNSLAIAVSGVNAAQTRLAVSADNVANQQSLAAPNAAAPAPDAGQNEGGRALFQPVRVIDQPLQGGGVRSATALVDPSAVQRFDPSAADANADGLVDRPNVRIEREMVEQIFARAQFNANLATIRAADELLESTLDILA